MDWRKGINNKLYFHLAGLFALLGVHFIADFYHFQQREGFNKYSPYLFLMLLYGWIVFHNLVLFDGLYLKGKKRAYFAWTALALSVSLLNMFFILYFGFNVSNPLPQMLNLIIYTILGWGIYMGYQYLKVFQRNASFQNTSGRENEGASKFVFAADNEKHEIPFENILYFESLENYIKVFTLQKIFIVRLPLKKVEQDLPSPLFIRISRSHIINTKHIKSIEQDSLRLGEKVFKIGKVYKKYVEDQLDQWKAFSS